MFQTLFNCMEELDTYVTNHNYDPTNRNTFVIPFVRDIVAREYSDDAISKMDQRHILFETACVVLLSMTKEPKYKDTESFLAVYNTFTNLTESDINEYYHFANYIDVALSFIVLKNNHQHLAQIGLRIVSGRGTRFISGSGMTVKNKRRGQILQVEANECRTLVAFSNAVKPYFDTINNNNVNGVLETFEKQIVTELPNVKVKGYSRSMAGVELVTNVFSKSSSDERINVTVHETRETSAADTVGRTTSKSVSLVERHSLDVEDTIYDEVDELFLGLNVDDYPIGTSISTTNTKTKDHRVTTTTINLKKSLDNPDRIASPRSPRSLPEETERSNLVRSLSKKHDSEEYELIRSTSNSSDLRSNHLNDDDILLQILLEEGFI